MSYGQPMFYVVSRKLGEAMQQGSRSRPPGTVYGIFASREKAEEALSKKRVFTRTKTGETLPIQPAIIVEL